LPARPTESEDAAPRRLTDRKRLAIVQAAAMEFQTRGYFSTSMNVIAATANVSKRTLYNHFDSKEALFDAIIEELTQKAELLPECSFDPTRDLREQLVELAEAEVQFMTSASVVALARAGISRVLAEPEVGKKIDHRRFHKRVKSWLDDALAAGVSVITIGQYLQPSRKNLPVVEYITPEQFEHLRLVGIEKGFRTIESAPLVRSSYHAERHL